MGSRAKKIWRNIASICLAGILIFACIPMPLVSAENHNGKSVGTYFNRTDKKTGELLEKTATLVNGSDNDYEIALKLRPPKTLYLPGTKTTDIVLIIDASASMGKGPDSGYNNIMSTVKSAAQTLVTKVMSNKQLKGKVRFSVVSFNTDAQNVCDWSSNANSINKRIQSIREEGGTNTEAGFEMARQKLANSSADKKYAVLFSDGQPTYRTSVLSTTLYQDWYNYYCEDDYALPHDDYYRAYIYEKSHYGSYYDSLVGTRDYLRNETFGSGDNDDFKYNEQCALAHAEMLKQPKGATVTKNIYYNDDYYNNKYKVGVIKGKGVGATLITVGYKKNADSGTAFLKAAATSSDFYFSTENPSAISKVFTNIENIITQKAVDTVVTDIVDSRFEILKNQPYEVTIGGKTEKIPVLFDGQKVTVKLGKIESIDQGMSENGKDIIIKFRAHLKDESFTKAGNYKDIPTNESASVTYKQGNETHEQIFEKPKVTIKRTSDILGSSKEAHLTDWEKREYQITLNCWTQKDKFSEKSRYPVEGVKVTDVLDSRFQLTKQARADLLASGTLITDNKNGTTTLVWNNLKIGDKGTTSAFLRKIMVQAKPNFIGGNNITTNVWEKSGTQIGKSDFVAFASQPAVNVRLTLPIQNRNETIWIGQHIPVDGVVTDIAAYLGQPGFSHKWFEDSSCKKPTDLRNIGDNRPYDTVKYYLQVSYNKAGKATKESNQNSTLNGKIYSVLPQNCKAVGIYTVDVQSASLQINKTLTEPIPSDDKSQYPFVFRIERRDSPNGPINETFYQTIVFNSEDSLHKTAKIVKMKKGYYTVTEEQGDSWRYKPVSGINSTVQKITVNNPVQYEISYENMRVNSSWLGNTGVVVNTEQE